MHTRQKPVPQVKVLYKILVEAGFELWALASSPFHKWPSCGFLLMLSRVPSNLTSNYNRENLGSGKQQSKKETRSKTKYCTEKLNDSIFISGKAFLR